MAAVDDVTLTRIEQTALGWITALFNVTEKPPAAAVTLAELPQFVKEAETGFARATPEGKLSVMDA